MTHKKAFASCEPTCIGCEGKLENVCRCPYKLQILSQLMKKDLDTQAGRLNFCSTNCISCSHRINRHCLQSLVHSLGYSSAFSGSGIICSDTSINCSCFMAIPYGFLGGGIVMGKVLRLACRINNERLHDETSTNRSVIIYC